MTKSDEVIKQKIKDLDAIMEIVDEPYYISFLNTTRRTLEWVLE